MGKITHFLRSLTPAHWLIIFCLLAGSFLRLWNFRNTLQFLGDQGRDASIVRKIFTEFDLVFIGPTTSTGNMYLGPLYYYFMVPFLMMSYPDPIGPAYAVAVLSIITIFLMYFLGKELVGKRAALIGMVLFTFSATVIHFARFSWNPNPAPLVSIVLLWAIHRAITKTPWYFVLASGCIATLIQLHYVSLLAVPSTGIFWLLSVKKIWWDQKAEDKKSDKAFSPRNFMLATGAAFVIFLAFLIPQFLFDFKHDWQNVRSFSNFAADSQDPLEQKPVNEKIGITLKETHGRSLHVLSEMFLGKKFEVVADIFKQDEFWISTPFELYPRITQRDFNTFLILVIVSTFVYLLKSTQDTSLHKGYQILFSFFFFSILGLSFYRGSVFDHYLAFLFPVSLLMYAVVIDTFWKQKFGVALTIPFFLLFFSWNYRIMPLRDNGWTIDEMKMTANSIAERVSQGEKFDIVLYVPPLGKGDIQGDNYRYILEAMGEPPVPKDQRATADTLFIINEEYKGARVVDSPIWEIVIFPNKVQSEVYTIPDGPEITVLRR